MGERAFGPGIFGWGTNGRPPKFTDPSEMQELISGYFEGVANGDIDNQEIVVGVGDQRKVISIPKPTIMGLVLFLGFDGRQSFYDYEKKEDFSYTIKRARSFLEHEYELQIRIQNNPSGAIFALKNFGWKDEHQISVSEETENLSKYLKELAATEDELDPADDVQDDSPETAAESTENN